jgi:PKD repeat protein
MEDSSFAMSYQRDQIKLKQDESLAKAGTVYKIPVVFHVLHNGGSENISRAQILDGLRVLNRDFRKLNADANSVVSAFQHLIADVEIEFVLATKAPNGDCFGGITRTKTVYTVDTDDDAHDADDQINAVVNGNDVYQGYWDPSKYLNIFICKFLPYNAAGYTNYPSSFYHGDMYGNGIFMRSGYIGEIGTSSPITSRTLTHECGHWLNLAHTWGSTNEPGLSSNCSTDDGVSDTPNTIGVRSCNLPESTCGVLANVENYMDYSYCRKMFTLGQKSRMRAALQSSIAGRNNLWQTSNLQETGALGNPEICVVDFSTNTKVVCVGGTVEFTDNTYNSPTAWNWTFQGGIPASSTSQNPTVTYSTPGIYPVSLTASNSVNALTEVKTQLIKVVSETGIAPIQESFEYVNAIPSDHWFVENPDNAITWELTNGAAALGSQCVMIQNDANNAGNIDELESTTITLDLNLSASISFDYAYAKRATENNDRLLLKVSKDCGETWVTKKILSGSILETAPTTWSSFVPNSTQWKTATVSSGSLVNYLESDFRMKFIFESDGGNNIYIDNINISGPVSVEESALLEAFLIYPNPVEDEAIISFKANNKVDNIDVLDVVGKKVMSLDNGQFGDGQHRYVVDTQNFSSGVYFIVVTKDSRKEVHKFMVK